MGRDNQPKERQRRDLERRQQCSRARCERILIVSEGSKTEPLYFNEIRMSLRLPVRNIAVFGGALGTDPLQIVQYAKDLFLHGDLYKGIEPRAFERIFAVFDRDRHHGYFEALHQAEILDGRLRNDEKQPVPFKAIASVPSFELWLLLHYQDVQAPLYRDEALQRLRQNFPDYAKGVCNAYASTRDRLDIAMQRAERLATKFTAHSGSEPFTAVAALVKLLMTLSK